MMFTIIMRQTIGKAGNNGSSEGDITVSGSDIT